jgi:hypothetical protein
LEQGWGIVNAAAAVETPAGNQAPIAVAGADQSVRVGSAVQLDGSESIDPDGDSITYEWTLIRPGPSAAVLSGDTTAEPTFVADVEGTYKVELQVYDGVLSDFDTVMITAQPNKAPTANAGPDQTVSDADSSGSEVVVLDGSACDDPDGTIATYGEYLAFDVSTDGGGWVEKAALTGNFDQEDTWHYTQVDLMDIGNLRIRFRGTMSGSREDAYVDMVEVIAW